MRRTFFICSAIILFAFAWWAPIVLAGAWLATHWLLRESAVWFDRNTPEVRAAQRAADYAYRLAVDPPRNLLVNRGLGVGGLGEKRRNGLQRWPEKRFVDG